MFLGNHGGEEAKEINKHIDQERSAVVNTLLASHSIDVNIQKIDFDAPIHMLRYDHDSAPTVAEKLLECGADLAMRNKNAQTALHLACKAGATNIARVFLDSGCCIGAQDKQGLNSSTTPSTPIDMKLPK
ncbi:hypothetical protein BDW59DRAFT_157940 [Aspergillus cavernicola]|uniref:Ankyrin repeat-containing domain protein n=1 Tax=Aspergillus cavernicola TaxID=176166 RepID=A0ABR4IUT3_9EURO